MKNSLILGTALLYSIFSFAQIDDPKSPRIVEENKNYNEVEAANPVDKISFVNPFIGTGGHGHTYPGATMPFGMIQLSPDTRHTGWDGCSGYHYSDSIIYGFSHTHLSGTGVSDYGDLLIIPQSGKPKIDPGYTNPKGYGSQFSHETETASPGFYSVRLKDDDINVRLTVSKRAGIHEYVYNNEKGKKFILIDLDHRDKLLSSSINIIDKTTISGSRISSAWAENQHFYFYLNTNIPYQKARVFEKNGRHKLLLIFPKETNKIFVKVGISAVNEDGAKMNLETEIPNWDFDEIKKNATETWEKELNKIYFYTADNEVMTNFYTALYHSYLAPNIFNDVSGQYRGMDNNIHPLRPVDGNQYTVFSLWDTYRATHPLFTLTQVDRTNEFINTFIRQFNQSGDLPVWELAGNETECMIGYHSVSVMADALVKGISGYDHFKATAAAASTAGYNEFGKRQFLDFGYINAGDEPESVSKTLEYSYDNYCVYLLLDDALKGADVPLNAEGSKIVNGMFNFINVFDPSTKFMRARRGGRWFSPFDPAEVNFNYTEANSWQYSLYAPHAVGVLTKLIGGKDSLELWLDRLFTTESDLSGRHQVDITGLIGQYAHGNEPSHHMAYLYNYTNAPHKTQYYTDRILREMYTDKPDGLSGNEDCGQMSSWYVLSSLGIYQIAPGNPNYDMGRPLMDEAILHFENGKSLHIKVIGNKTDVVKYVESVSLNGKLLGRSYLRHEELIEGGELVFNMSDEPNLDRVKYTHAPTIDRVPEDFVPLPYFEQEDYVFTDSMDISLDVIGRRALNIFYTLDGSEPTLSSTVYTKPFNISETTTIKMFATGKKAKSATLTNVFVKKDNSIDLTLNSEYANQYAAGGEFTLVDKRRGGNEYRTGDWQGFWAQDLNAEVTFDNPRFITEVGLGCLSDMKSWIFFPSQLDVEISYDGINFEDRNTLTIPTESQEDMGSHHKDFMIKIEAIRPVKKIRLVAKSFGSCPEWHLGSGNDTWLFVDEILFR